MIYSPFSVLMGYDAPDGKGIYTKPASDAVPEGWGEPRWDKTTTPWTPITPGTEGGPMANVLIRKKNKDTSYKATASKYFQKGGNISWWGTLRSADKPGKGRHVLSYNGPKLRYFRDEDFHYGDEQSHTEIYYLGNYAAIAPGPVLGACIRKMNWADPADGTTKEVTFLIVVIAENGTDAFYRRRWEYSCIPSDKMTDEKREGLARIYDFQTNPFGWMRMGFIPKQTDAYPAETPWFFSQSGHECACMRRRKITFNNGDSDVTEDMFERYKVTISANGEIDFNNNGNAPPMQYVESYDKKQLPYSQADHYGFGHSWREDHVKVSITLDGEQFVMCDYVEDTLCYGKIKYQVQRKQEEYYTIGTDPANYTVVSPQDGSTRDISNRDSTFGPYGYNWGMWGYKDPDYVVSPADHEWTVWTNITQSIKLYYGPAGSEEEGYIELHQYTEGTSDVWAGNPRQDKNPFWYFFDFYTRYLRGFLDIRHLAFFSQDVHKYGLAQTAGGDSWDTTRKSKESLFTAENLSGQDYRSVKKSGSGTIILGWPRPDMITWAAEFNTSLPRTTYTGAWPASNVGGALQQPGCKTFYNGDSIGDMKSDWPTISDLLASPNNKVKGNGVRTDREEVGFSIEVPDEEKEGRYVKISDTKPAGKPESLIGYGETFYPVGTC